MVIFPLSVLSGERGSALPEPYRVGVYYAPAETDALWQVGCEWLGRDAKTGLSITQPNLPALAENTKDPRRYGFHATLKAPFVPRHGFQSFLNAAACFASEQKSFDLPILALTQLHGFLALCPAEASPRLHLLAADCVKILDEHRTPESASQQAQRGAGKTERQISYIAKWGYPFVFEDFHFHITLTGQMQNNPYFHAAHDHFSAALAQTRRVDHLSIFIEETKGAPFQLFCRLPFSS